MTQLELNLGDHVQFARRVKANLTSGQSLYVRFGYYGHPRWWLMVRQHDLAGTDYYWKRWLSENEAKELVRLGIACEWRI